MRPEKTPARFAFLLLAVVGALLVSAAAEYVRPPPGRIILTENTQPPSHPQQVCIWIKNSECRYRLTVTSFRPTRREIYRHMCVSGPCIASRDEPHESFMGHGRQARALRGGLRQGLRQLHLVGHRRAHLLPLLPLLLRQDPPCHHRPAGSRHRLLLPVRHGRRRVHPQDPARRSTH
jgi:hypothetical protein